MWYFSYGHDLNDRSLAEWYDLNRLRAQPPRKMIAATAINFRIAFPVFSSYWQGGVAGMIPEPGKRVAGALIDLPDKYYVRIAEFNDALLDERGLPRSAFRPQTITVTPYTGGEAVEALAFVPVAPDDGHVPPTRLYMERLVEATLDLDLSAFWVMHLRSFPTGPEETSRYFPKRRIAPPLRAARAMTEPAHRDLAPPLVVPPESSRAVKVVA
jgi:hypothetical protein